MRVVQRTSISSGTLCVYNTLWDAFTIEMSQQIDQVEILKQERAVLADSLESLRVLNWASIGSRVERFLGVLESGRGLVVGHHDCY
jgi:hypothetical protein